MTTTIVTATYNKPKYLPDAAASVFRQTDPDWEWWIVLDGADEPTRRLAYCWAVAEPRIRVFDEPVTEQQRRERYRPAVIANQYFPRIRTDHIAWLSDDDVLAPRFLELLTGKLRENPDWDVVYGPGDQVRLNADGEWVHDRTVPRNGLPEFGPDLMPVNKLDGGQLVHTRRAYQALGGWQIPEGWAGTAHNCDGLYLNELAKRFTFHAIPENVLTHRCTPLSTHNKGRKA